MILENKIYPQPPKDYQEIFNLIKTDNIKVKHVRQERLHWEIEIIFLNKNIRASYISGLIWSLSMALSLIPDVKIQIDEWGTGSLWVKLKMIFPNLRKEDVKKLFDMARETIISDQHDKRIESARKIQEERRKIEAERDILEKEAALIPTGKDAEKIKALEIGKKELELMERAAEVQRKELENQKLALENIERASYLIKEGLVFADPVEIKINGSLYIEHKKGKYFRGVDIDEIDNKGLESVDIDKD